MIVNDQKMETQKSNLHVKLFCDEFINSGKRPKYLFGRNIYANKIVCLVGIDGFIDDYADEKEYLGKPVIRLEQVPENALVLILSAGKPFTAENRVRNCGLEYIHYFDFYRFSGLPLDQVMFLDGFAEDFKKNRSKYEWIYNLLHDGTSKKQFYKLVNFKNSYDWKFLRGFASIEDKQYFEDFLKLEKEGETFVDVGGFDGGTSREFMRLCPHFDHIHLFEPEENSIKIAKSSLKYNQNVDFYQLGLSNRKQTLCFDVNGSSSKICHDGCTMIDVDRLDDIVSERVTYIKMDIEGSEGDAIEGAKNIITKHRPKLAICVYHKSGDFWQIPEQILAIRNDYNIYLRHYTESIYETVMYFV